MALLLYGAIHRRPADPLRQHKIVLLVACMAALLYAGGVTWERQEAVRLQEEARIAAVVLADPMAAAWLGSEPRATITLAQPNPDLTGAPLRYQVTAQGSAGRVRAVVEADRRVAPPALTVACVERELVPAVREKPPLRCRR